MEVAPGLLPALVEQYLLDGGFHRTLREFRSEARLALSERRAMADNNVHSLATVLTEYNRLCVKERQHAALCEKNPVLKHILEVVDSHASTAAGGPDLSRHGAGIMQDGNHQLLRPPFAKDRAGQAGDAGVAAFSTPPRPRPPTVGEGLSREPAGAAPAEDTECWRDVNLHEGAMLVAEELPSSSDPESIDLGSRARGPGGMQQAIPEAAAASEQRRAGTATRPISEATTQLGAGAPAMIPAAAGRSTSNRRGVTRKRLRRRDQTVGRQGGRGDGVSMPQAVFNPFVNVSMDHVDSFLATLNYGPQE